MKHFVLLSFAILVAAITHSQVTYTTNTISGDYTANGTWVGGSLGKPGITGTCGCTIIIKPGHTLILNNSVNITNANFILEGASSILTFGNNRTLILQGTSSIDLQNISAMIKSAHVNNTITLGGLPIFTSSTMFNSTIAGEVKGLASASSIRANPNFQNGTLPVTLSAFKANNDGKKVTLSWTTELEINSDRFEIERSIDSRNWNTIGTVSAGGNVGVSTNYSYADLSPLKGTNHYRLKMIDTDTKYEYSPVRSIHFNSNGISISTNPNPATSMLNISINSDGSESFRLKIINRSGQVLYDQKYSGSTNRLTLPVSNYSEGSYFIEISNNSGLRQISKVLILRK